MRIWSVRNLKKVEFQLEEQLRCMGGMKMPLPFLRETHESSPPIHTAIVTHLLYVPTPLLRVCLAVLDRSNALTQVKCYCVSNAKRNGLSTGVWSVQTCRCVMDSAIFANGANNPDGDVVS